MSEYRFDHTVRFSSLTQQGHNPVSDLTGQSSSSPTSYPYDWFVISEKVDLSKKNVFGTE